MLSKRMTFYGGHFPWPGVGHVAEEKGDCDIFRKPPDGFPNNRVVHATLRPIPNGVLQSIYIYGYLYGEPKSLGCLCSLSATGFGSGASEGSPQVSFISDARILWLSSAVC
jgi:hypothetical protein